MVGGVCFAEHQGRSVGSRRASRAVRPTDALAVKYWDLQQRMCVQYVPLLEALDALCSRVVGDLGDEPQPNPGFEKIQVSEDAGHPCCFKYGLWDLKGDLCCLSKLWASSGNTSTRCGWPGAFCVACQSCVLHLVYFYQMCLPLGFPRWHQSCVLHVRIFLPDMADSGVSVVPLKVVCFVWAHSYQIWLPQGFLCCPIRLCASSGYTFTSMWLPQGFMVRSKAMCSIWVCFTRYGCPRAFGAAYKSYVPHVSILLPDVAALGLSVLPVKVVCFVWVHSYQIWLTQGFLCCLSKLCDSSGCTYTRCGCPRAFSAAYHSAVLHLGILLPDVAAQGFVCCLAKLCASSGCTSTRYGCRRALYARIRVVSCIWVYFYQMWLSRGFVSCLRKSHLGLLVDVAALVSSRVYLLPRFVHWTLEFSVSAIVYNS